MMPQLLNVTTLLGLLILSIFVESTHLVSDGILAVTGVIVAWYTYVTNEMKKEMIKQTKLSSSPFALIEEKDRKFYLKNYGSPAINIEISGIDLGEYDTFIFPKILFLPPNNEIEIVGKTKSGSSFIDQNLFVYWQGRHGSKFEITASIKYDDLAGQRYETLMRVGRGDHKILHRKEIK